MLRTLHVMILLALCCDARAQNCTGTSVGSTPLSDLGPGLYKGFPGGLYPGGLGVPPADHLTMALRIATRLVPRDALGNPSPAGKLVLLSIGMSNTTAEFATFVPLANADPRKSPSVVLVDGAQGGQTASIIRNPNASFWTIVGQRLAAASTSAAQVAAVWLKEANAQPTRPFPAEALALQSDLEAIAQVLRAKFPNLQLCYLSSRIYAGYATSTLNPEPHAYETGFAVRWLIADQIAGKSSLNFDPTRGPVVAPLLLWGPYLWADGLVPRSDGLTWLCSEFQSDGTHPAAGGRAKVASKLLDFFTSDPTATPWFVAGRGTACGLPADVERIGAGTAGANGTPQLGAARLPQMPGQAPFGLRVTGARPSSSIALVVGTEALGVPFLGGVLYPQPLVAIATTSDGLGVAGVDLGVLAFQPSSCGVRLRWQAAVADPTGPFGLLTLSAGLDTVLGD
jgi:hypothetical protein